eukprot:3179999-Prymnesium_polylepis.2
MQYQARKVRAHTLGVKQKASTSDTGNHWTAPLAAGVDPSDSDFSPAKASADTLSRPQTCWANLMAAPTRGIATITASGTSAFSSSSFVIPLPTTHADGTTQFVQSSSPKNRKKVVLRSSQGDPIMRR